MPPQPKLLVTETYKFKSHSGVPGLSQNVPKCPPEETLGCQKDTQKVTKRTPKRYQQDTERVPHPTLRYGTVAKRYGAGVAHACACDAATKYDYKNRVLHQNRCFY